MGTLLECGQTLPNILLQMSSASSTEPYRRAWKTAYEETRKGVRFSVTLRTQKSLFPQIVPDMLAIGEKTGSLASMLKHIARMYEEDIDEFCKKLGTSVEPVLMIFMGLIVGSIALSIVLPIYEITNHLTQ